MIVDTPPTHHEASLGLIANAAFLPVIGPALWRIKPDFSVRKGLEVAFAPGFDVPDEFVEDVNADDLHVLPRLPRRIRGLQQRRGPRPARMKASGKPLMVLMGAEEQIVEDPAARLAEYRRTYPGTETKLIQGAGHSPNVEKPAETAALVLAFDRQKTPAKPVKQRLRATPIAETGSRPRGTVESNSCSIRKRQQQPA